MVSGVVLSCPSENAVRELTEALKRRGLCVVRSFDLRLAMASSGPFECPHHGTTDCECQLVVLLVYGSSIDPITVTVHSNGPSTSVELIETSPAVGGADLRGRVQASLSDIFGARVEAAWL
ncbi:MAG: hypothetical protein WDA71_14775 [Actinomycetota bacterium]